MVRVTSCYRLGVSVVSPRLQLTARSATLRCLLQLGKAFAAVFDDDDLAIKGSNLGPLRVKRTLSR